MRMSRGKRGMAAAVLLATGLSVAGCRIEKDEHGDGKNVRIATPFGDMQVKTDDSEVLAGIGLPQYPGATLVKEHGDNKGAADVNMSFGKFQLKVKAASFHTNDRQEQVIAFYKKALGRYGIVIECQHGIPVGTPTQTDEGLTCGDTDHGPGNHNGDDGGLKLKAGSKKRQHLVEIKDGGPGTKFALISLDLPVDFGNKGGDE